MGSLFGSITIKGNRLTDLVGQTSTVGKPIPFGYGKCKVTEPNVIWTAGIPKEHVKKKKQGKGGVKTEEYTYTLSYAIAFMAGPIHSYLTIKRGGKVVFTTDPSASVDDQAYAAKWQQKAKLYLGTRTQMPDSTIESYKGAGQVSAFRDLAYIVVEDDDVTGEGGAVPQYEAVIIAQGPAYATTPPYPYMFRDALNVVAPTMEGDVVSVVKAMGSSDAMSLSSMLVSGDIRKPLQEYAFEDAMGVSAILTAGEIRSILRTYGFEDAMTVTSSMTAGEVKKILVTLSTPKDAITISSQLTGGTFT